MPIDVINGLRIFWEEHGPAGAPVVLVHGSWGDHHNWDAVVPGLAAAFRVVTYDRRGHSQSERPLGQGRIDEDVADLAALVSAKALAPAHLVGNSYGAAIVLKLACVRPDLFASMAVHEPPLLGMLEDHPALPTVRERIAGVLDLLRAGQNVLGAQRFVETVALGAGMWEMLPPEMQQIFVMNAPTFLDEQNEPDTVMTVDLGRLSTFPAPTMVTQGDQSPGFFGVIVDKIASALPHARRHTFRGAGHVPHLTAADEYVRVLSAFIDTASVTS